MKGVNYQNGAKLFKPEDICDKMLIVVHGMVEMNMQYDNSKLVLERFGRGTVINSFNFMVEEEMYVTAKLASKKAAIYHISKNDFFDFVTKDKKLTKHILKLLIEDVKNLDPPVKYLDFIRPKLR